MADHAALKEKLMSLIRPFPDFPTKGVLFRDIMPIFKHPAVVKDVCSMIADVYKKDKVEALAGLEARGFLFGPQAAANLNVPFVCIRKKGKLPGEVVQASYKKEYGLDTIEVQKDCIQPNSRVVIFDDVLATGGTMAGAIDLVKKCGGNVVGVYCLIELKALNGRAQLPADVPVKCFLEY